MTWAISFQFVAVNYNWAQSGPIAGWWKVDVTLDFKIDSFKSGFYVLRNYLVLAGIPSWIFSIVMNKNIGP